MKDIAKVPTAMNAADANPLKQLPSELVVPAGMFFTFYSDSLKGSTGLVARLLWWMRQPESGGEGLTAAEAKAALEGLMRPETAMSAAYAGQVLSLLAIEVDLILKERRKKEEEARKKKAREGPGGQPASMDDIRKLTSSFGKMT